MNDKEFKTTVIISALALTCLLIGSYIGLTFTEEMSCAIPVPDQIQTYEDTHRMLPGTRVTCNSEGCMVTMKLEGYQIIQENE